MRFGLRRSEPPTLRERIMERIPFDRLMDRVPLEQIRERIPFQMKPEPPSRIRRAAPLVAAGAAGAALAFVFDPDRGKGRRVKAREMVAGQARRTVRATRRRGRYIAGKANGIRHRAAHGIARHDGPPLDDMTLVDKIKSQALGGRYDQTRVVINADRGMIELRGEVDTPQEMTQIERAVRRVPEVVEVDNLLHIKGSAPVNKLRARQASTR